MTVIQSQSSPHHEHQTSIQSHRTQASVLPQKAGAPLILTTGEPAGIGMDILLQLVAQGALADLQRDVIVLADETALKERSSQIYGADSLYDADSLGQCASLWQRIATFDELSSVNDVATHLHQLLAAHKDSMSLEVGQVEQNKQSSLSKKPLFYLIDVPCANPVSAGKLDVGNAKMVIDQLNLAHRLTSSGGGAAIVTGPLQKSILIEAGLTLDDGSMFTGHTEFFMQKSGCDKVVMMLANTAMKVALVTIHLPLSAVAAAVTPDNVRQTVQIVLDDLNRKFGLQQPRVLVCGLNPHAGEDGHLGREEIEIINPVLKAFQEQGHDISSAMPADTLFTARHLNNCDAVIAMYHDQGLPVLKSHGFGDTVNLTLGLPYIRTSVDHGTALDLAGNSVDSGQVANSQSLWQALKMADGMAYNQERRLR